MKNIIFILRFTLVSIILIFILSCDNEDSQTEVLPFTSNFNKLYPGGTPVNNGIGQFNEGIWTHNNIRLSSSTNSLVDWVEFKDININGIGQYSLLYNPYAKAKFEAIYSTSLDPDFHINQGNVVPQGGILNITEYNDNSISGNYFFVAWYFSNTLNREVAWGISGDFENILFE